MDSKIYLLWSFVGIIHLYYFYLFQHFYLITQINKNVFFLRQTSLKISDLIYTKVSWANYVWRLAWFFLVISFWQLELHCLKNIIIRHFSGPYFPAFGINMEWYFMLLRIQSESGKIQTRKTLNTDTFHAMLSSPFFHETQRFKVFVDETKVVTCWNCPSDTPSLNIIILFGFTRICLSYAFNISFVILQRSSMIS